ncbi:6-phosphogluconolactonase [Sphingomonas sp. BE138]|uniref:lactonase family protein n=1 Tax=Sphingomonas sp. BE138 TaxID=2817845 RepID=UPI0028602997|nr:beta-propeller fold lactonase family protein [Sphingomonas sp. BE138]MDR6789305.1 6-phosphogluconolactonase [Sphingomonas sp. BE138]
MTRVLVGTYAASGGPGLLPIERAADGRWTPRPPLPHVRNASWIVASDRHGLRYAVDEIANEMVVYHGEEWTRVAAVPSGGSAPCHLALAPDHRRLAVANYGSGSVTLLSLGEDGLPQGAETWTGAGRGPDADRQEGPHAHWVGFAPGGSVIHIDLGADRIMADDRALYAAPPGSGPRHLVRHPSAPLAYLVSELASTLTVLDTRDRPWRATTIVSTLPEGVRVESLGGEIVLDAATGLHVSNRGHDSIATFALDDAGQPRLVRHVASDGRSPRFLLPVGDELLVAHEEGGGVTVLAAADGYVRQQLDVPGAAFLMIDHYGA